MRQKRLLFFILILILAGLPLISPRADEGWQLEKSDHFLIYYQKDLSRNYLGQVKLSAESYYRNITDSLGFRRFDFWTWDNRCKIYLYATDKGYQDNMAKPNWVGGDVNVETRTISTYMHGEDFIESVLPHEMGHLIFREFIGLDKKLPLWIDEGVACLNERKYISERLNQAKQALKTGYITLNDLSQMNSASSIEDPQLFYAEAMTAIRYLVENYSSDKFYDFCRKVRDNEPWLESLLKTYRFKDLSEFNQNWRTFLQN